MPLSAFIADSTFASALRRCEDSDVETVAFAACVTARHTFDLAQQPARSAIRVEARGG
jgi:hypothetical protein